MVQVTGDAHFHLRGGGEGRRKIFYYYQGRPLLKLNVSGCSLDIIRAVLSFSLHVVWRGSLDIGRGWAQYCRKSSL